MRWLLFLITLFTPINSFAESINTEKVSLILKEGWLINASSISLYSVEIVSPFYKYLGDLAPYQKKAISFINTRFKVKFLIKTLGGYKEMEKEFIPSLRRTSHPQVKIEINYQNCLLKIKVSSLKPLDYCLIEIPQDYPVHISEDRKRYVFSDVAVLGQNLIAGDYAEFRLYPLKDEKLYKVPIQVSFIYNDTLYEKLLFYYLKKEELCLPSKD